MVTGGHGVFLGLLLLGVNTTTAHQRLPASTEWNDFPVQLHEGSYRRDVPDRKPRVRLRTNFQPELQKSVDHL